MTELKEILDNYDFEYDALVDDKFSYFDNLEELELKFIRIQSKLNMLGIKIYKYSGLKSYFIVCTGDDLGTRFGIVDINTGKMLIKPVFFSLRPCIINQGFGTIVGMDLDNDNFILFDRNCNKIYSCYNHALSHAYCNETDDMRIYQFLSNKQILITDKAGIYYTIIDSTKLCFGITTNFNFADNKYEVLTTDFKDDRTKISCIALLGREDFKITDISEDEIKRLSNKDYYNYLAFPLY